MTRRDPDRVADILGACRKLSEVAEMGRAEYDRNWIVRSAVERQLEIIGEAASRLSEDFFETSSDLPIRQAKALRNVISHEYFSVDHDRIWNVVTNRVPELVSSLASYRKRPAES